MSPAAPKLFKRESGQMRAVTKEAQELLEVTKAVVDHVKSDPPPANSLSLPPEGFPDGVQIQLPPPQPAQVPRPQLAKVPTERAKGFGLYRVLPGKKGDDEG
jgi:hypothetical protein